MRSDLLERAGRAMMNLIATHTVEDALRVFVACFGNVARLLLSSVAYLSKPLLHGVTKRCKQSLQLIGLVQHGCLLVAATSCHLCGQIFQTHLVCS